MYTHVLQADAVFKGLTYASPKAKWMKSSDELDSLTEQPSGNESRPTQALSATAPRRRDAAVGNEKAQKTAQKKAEAYLEGRRRLADLLKESRKKASKHVRRRRAALDRRQSRLSGATYEYEKAGQQAAGRANKAGIDNGIVSMAVALSDLNIHRLVASFL